MKQLWQGLSVKKLKLQLNKNEKIDKEIMNKEEPWIIQGKVERFIRDCESFIAVAAKAQEWHLSTLFHGGKTGWINKTHFQVKHTQNWTVGD